MEVMRGAISEATMMRGGFSEASSEAIREAIREAISEEFIK